MRPGLNRRSVASEADLDARDLCDDRRVGTGGGLSAPPDWDLDECRPCGARLRNRGRGGEAV